MHEITLIPPLPAGKGGWGKECKLKAGLAGNKEGKPPTGDMDGRSCKCRRRSNAGVPGAKPPAK